MYGSNGSVSLLKQNVQYLGVRTLSHLSPLKQVTIFLKAKVVKQPWTIFDPFAAVAIRVWETSIALKNSVPFTNLDQKDAACLHVASKNRE